MVSTVYWKLSIVISDNDGLITNGIFSFQANKIFDIYANNIFF